MAQRSDGDDNDNSRDTRDAHHDASPGDGHGRAHPGHAAVRVLAAVIQQDGRWLLCRRPGHKRHGGCWEFPGGKVERGETLFEAAVRELREELAVKVVSVGDVVFSARDPDSPFVIEFVAVAINGEPAALEHDEIRWLDYAEAVILPLAPADRAFLETHR
jgi:mutator protein MutT